MRNISVVNVNAEGSMRCGRILEEGPFEFVWLLMPPKLAHLQQHLLIFHEQANASDFDFLLPFSR